MSAHYSLFWTIERGLESYEIEIMYCVTSWGAPATGPSYASGGDPADPMELELEEAWIPAPPWALGRYPYDVIPFALTDAERWKIEEWIQMNPPEPDYPEYERGDEL